MRFVLFAPVMGAVSLAAVSPAAADWSRSYVVEYFEPAMFFPDDAAGRDRAGSDCPDGINPENDWLELLTTDYRSREEVEQILDPEFRAQGGNMYSHFPIRGPNRTNVYEHPDSIPDPGMIEVTGEVAYGFDLDGDATNGFVSPDGQHGIDNAFYKASGCILRYRGARHEAGSASYSMEDMRNGAYTIVIVLSGPGNDPRNDPDAQMAIYRSVDKVVKDAAGDVAEGYSFRISPDVRFQTVLDVHIEDGVIATDRPQQIKMRDVWAARFFPEELVLEQAKIRFTLDEAGNLNGMIGGYRDWYQHYIGSAGNGSWGSGAIHENLGQFSLPAWWYSLRRNADGLPDPETGEMHGISTAYFIDAIPAHVVTPDATSPVVTAQIFD